MEHQIVVVADDALPTRHDWALVESDDYTIFAVKASAMSPDAMAEGWAAYRMADRLHTPCRQTLPPMPPIPPTPSSVLLQLLPRGA